MTAKKVRLRLSPQRKLASEGIALLLLLAAACATTVKPTSSPAPPTQEVQSTRLTALLTGQLLMDGHCLRVQAAPGPSSYLLVWPPDIVPSVDGETVRVMDLLLKRQITWRLGHTVQVGGGVFSSQNDPSIPLPPGCPSPYWIVSGWPEPAVTATPPAAETPPAAVITFTSSALGITFSYLTSQLGTTISTHESGDKVFVYYTDQPAADGQYVQVLPKAPGDTLQQAIQKQFLAGVDPAACPLIDFRLPSEAPPMPPSYVFTSIRLPSSLGNPADYDIATAAVEAQKCPQPYTEYGGQAYFMEDTLHPDRFFFFNIGQHSIFGPAATGYGATGSEVPWQYTLRVLDKQSPPTPSPTGAAQAVKTASPAPPTVADAFPILVNYFSAPGRFIIRIPTLQSMEAVTSTQTIQSKVVSCNALVSRDNGALWIVQYCDFPAEAISQTTSTALLDSAQDQALSRLAHKLIDQRDITLNGMPGRLIMADINMRNNNGPFDGVLKARLFVAQNRVYTVTAEVYTETAETRLSMIDSFLESFSIESP